MKKLIISEVLWKKMVIDWNSAKYFFSKKAGTQFLLLALIPVVFGCLNSKNRIDLSSEKSQDRNFSCSEIWTRNFKLHPSIELLDSKGKVYFLGDVHGEIEKTADLLRLSGLVEGTVNQPIWSGGRSILISVGDLINKGSDSLGAVNYFMNLQEKALVAGGRVIVVSGNHEQSFLTDPNNPKSEKFMEQISSSLGLAHFCDDVYSQNSKVGRWLRDLPAAVKVNSLFVSHTGFPKFTLAEIDSNFREYIGSSGRQKKFACGDTHGDKRSQGFFNAEGWWRKSGNFLAGASRLGVFQILFGHDPGAFGSRGKIEGYYGDSSERALIKLDVGLVTGDSEGELLRCDNWSQSGACRDFVRMQRNTQAKSPGTVNLQGGFIQESRLIILPGNPPPSREGEPENEC